MQSEILAKLQKETDLHRRRLLLVAYICSELVPQNVKPILVGGNAVELYTFGDYATHDIDLVTPQRDEIANLLGELGFNKEIGFRHWYHEQLELFVEIPDDKLAGDLTRITEVEIDEYTAYVIGIEDLLIDRLNAYVHWKSISDFEQAAKIFSLHREDIDMPYLKYEAEAQGLLAALTEIETLGNHSL